MTKAWLIAKLFLEGHCVQEVDLFVYFCFGAGFGLTSAVEGAEPNLVACYCFDGNFAIEMSSVNYY